MVTMNRGGQLGETGTGACEITRASVICNMSWPCVSRRRVTKDTIHASRGRGIGFERLELDARHVVAGGLAFDLPETRFQRMHLRACYHQIVLNGAGDAIDLFFDLGVEIAPLRLAAINLGLRGP